MANANPLFDDLGTTPATASAQPDNPLFSDLGTPKQPSGTTSSPPDSDEWNKMGLIDKNIAVAKAAPRWLLEGTGKLADTATDVVGSAFSNDIGGKTERNESEENQPFFEKIAHVIADRMGLPKTPDSRAGRIIGAGVTAAPSAVIGGPESILPSLVPTMASGAASQTAAEAGAGPIGQTVAGLLPFAPSALAAGARGLVRGGEEGAASMQENLNNAENAGIKTSVGQSANGPLSPVLRTAETVGSKIPGGGALADTRGAGLNQQAEESVSNITKKLAPNYNLKPPTPTAAGEAIEDSAKKTVARLKNETGQVSDAMFEAGGGKEAPVSAPKLAAVLPQVTGETGMPEIDKLITGAKTKTLAKTAQEVETANKPSPASYSTDGEGAHVATSPNGETHAVEQANGDLKVTRSDTAAEAQGKGEGTDRLETLAHAATGQGKNLVSDISVSPAEAAAYEKLGKRGWQVTKNPNAEVNPETGNIISDSPKNPVYSVRAPKTEGGPVGPTAPKTPGFGDQRMDWTYNPKTGQSEPATGNTPSAPTGPSGITASLNAPTPWTLDGLKQFRTDIGKSIGRTRDPVQQRQLSQLYGAASDDLGAHMTAQGPAAEQAWGLFNHVATQNAATQKTLVRAIKDIGGPEATFKAAMSGTKDGATKISPVIRSLDPEGKDLFRATVLHRLGRAGGAADAPFDANTYLRNWKGMAPEAKDMLFGQGASAGPPTQLRKSLDSISDTLDHLQSQGYIRSGMANAVSQGTHGLRNLGIMGVIALLGEHGASAAYHAAEGHPFLAAGAITGGMGVLAGNPIMSRVLTNPKTAAWLAQATKAPPGMVPVLINQLHQMGSKDPDAKDLAGLIEQAGSQAPTTPPPKETGVRETIYPKINRSAGMQPLPGGGYGIPPESF